MSRSDRLNRHWDRFSRGYDERLEGVERRFLAPSRPWVCARAEGRTLEIGVGTGKNFEHYFPEEVTLTGLELSAGMLEVARERAAEMGIDVDLVLADATDLPFEDQSFDTVLATFTLCGISGYKRALAEAYRVLRPGGRLLLADHVGATFLPLRVSQHLLDLVSVPLRGEHFARRPIRALPRIGFEIVQAQRFARGVIEHVHAVRPEELARAGNAG